MDPVTADAAVETLTAVQGDLADAARVTLKILAAQGDVFAKFQLAYGDREIPQQQQQLVAQEVREIF
jgi:hypothetical protein